MQTGESQTPLASGRALEDPALDKLGYSGFARTLANGIQKMMPPEGLVIAVYGAWGSGKTTMLNFIEHYLRKCPEDERPMIFKFNPWWFSGAQELTLHFFTEFRLVLGQSSGFGAQLLTNLASLAEIVSEPTPYAYLGKLTSWGLRKAAGKQEKDAFQLKKEITDALEKQNKKILIVIDDIDRLTADEIRQVFRVIKAVADFPNVVYLLAFDKKVVVAALGEMQGLSGEDYLEKIVQVPFELPLPSGEALYGLLFAELGAILADTPNLLFDRTYWDNLFIDGVRHFISTPRDVVRLTNTLRVTYPSVRGEVNAADFIAIETLRVFCPVAYDVVRRNSSQFTGHTELGLLGKPKELQPFHDKWLKQVSEDDVEAVKNLLTRLFPNFESVWKNISYTAEHESVWRRDRRICSSDVFPIFFRLAVPVGDISNREMIEVLSRAGDSNAFSAILREFSQQKRPDGTTKARIFLDMFMDYYQEIPIDSIPSVIETLLDVGDELLPPEDETVSFLGDRNEIRIGRIIWHLLPRLGEEQRYSLLNDKMKKGRALSIIVDTATSLARQHGKYKSQSEPIEKRFLTIGHTEQLEQVALERIRAAAREGTLVSVPNLASVLYRWREWAGEGEVKQWIERLVESDDGLWKFVDTCLSKVMSQSIEDRVVRIRYRIDPSLLEFIGTVELASRIERLVKSGRWSDEKRLVVDKFLRERTKPDSP